MRKFSLLLSAIVLLLPVVSVAQKKQHHISNESKAALVSYIKELQEKDTVLRHALWGIKVVNPTNGDVVVSHNEEASMSPASNMKLVTTGVGLLLLGTDFRFETHLKYDGEITADSTLTGNLYIVGGGDPTLGSTVFPQTSHKLVFSNWAKALKKAGIKRIAGSVVADPTTIFDDEYRPQTWSWGDISTGYGAGISGLQFMDNYFKIKMVASGTVGEPALIKSTEPYIPNVVFENFVTTVKADTSVSIDLLSSPYSPRIILTGAIAQKGKEYSQSAAIPDPAYTCAWYFNDYLSWNGIATSGNVEVYHTKALVDTRNLQIIDTYYSPTLAEIVKETNKVSNNSYAESILKMMAYKQKGVGSTNVGRTVVADALKNEGLSLGGVLLIDGSGLARKNMLTPAFVCDFLAMMQKSPLYKVYEESLPIAGVDGTMKNMLKGTAAEGNIKAKSGTLSDARGYSGYVTTKGGHTLCFSIIMNNYRYGSEITKRLEKLMRLIAEIN